MKGDFSRDTFDKAKHFSRVLMQQGRVQLDADWNEQTAILLHYLQSLAADLIGPHGGVGDSFEIKTLEGSNDFKITKGHYYVDGILCENEGTTVNGDFQYFSQPNYPLDTNKDKLTEGKWLVYLDVWERHLTHAEVESPDDSVISIREVALGGPDTATRAQIVWQAKLKLLNATDNSDFKNEYLTFLDALGEEKKPGTGSLRVRAKKTEDSKDPCLTAPESRYRGPENQLYRVEIHKHGSAGTATFKWSRENGSVIFPIRTLDGNDAILEYLGRDKCLGLQKDDWVEIVDDHIVLRGDAGQLAQVDEIDIIELRVILKPSAGANLPDYQKNDARHPLLRRWDRWERKEAEIPIKEGKTDNDWIELEDGIRIQFEPGGTYCTGDYWLIPARTATGDVEWPGPADKPVALPPHGVIHHYAPLAIISIENGNVAVTNLRRTLNQIWS